MTDWRYVSIRLLGLALGPQGAEEGGQVDGDRVGRLNIAMAA
jgi:hypothetical protein